MSAELLMQLCIGILYPYFHSKTRRYAPRKCWRMPLFSL